MEEERGGGQEEEDGHQIAALNETEIVDGE